MVRFPTIFRFFRLNVSRFSGRETQLRHVHVPGAYLVPGWAPEVARFTVYLNLEEERELGGNARVVL